MLAPVRTAAPAVTPISLDDAKAQCRVDHSDEDGLLTSLIEAAVSHVDGYAGSGGLALISQTWRQDFDGFADVMRLRVGPLMSVSSISYYDADNGAQTLSTDVYTVFADEIGPYIALKPDQSWPTSYSRDDAVRVTWTAGFGASATDVPMAIRQALLLLVAHWYDNRGIAVTGANATEIPMAAKSLLAPFRRIGV